MYLSYTANHLSTREGSAQNAVSATRSYKKYAICSALTIEGHVLDIWGRCAGRSGYDTPPGLVVTNEVNAVNLTSVSPISRSVSVR
jgi:hypothetical protein